MILDEIVAHKKLEIETQKRKEPLYNIKRKIDEFEAVRGFRNAISAPDKVNLIAEIKKASPSRGVIRSNFDLEAIARIYEDNGAAAISVLTDRKFFQGDLSFLAGVRSVTSSIPIFRKDFIIDEYQIYQSRAAGADAILLIAAVLDLPILSAFLDTARALDLDCLVEVHTEGELDMVLKTDTPVIGINNRDLYTFQTDIQTTARLAQIVPEDKIIVSESGISSREDVEFLEKCGVNAILVGESLMKSDDIGLKMRRLMSP